MITIGGLLCPHTPKITRSHISETYIGQDKSIQILLSVTVHSNFRITHSADSVRESSCTNLYLVGREIQISVA